MIPAAVLVIALQAPAQSATTELSRDDRDVLTVVLTHFKPDVPGPLLDTTARICETVVMGCIRQSDLDKIPRSAWAPTDAAALKKAFIDRNARPLNLGTLNVGIRKIPGEQIHATAMKVGVGIWREISSRFPDTRGVLQVSAPAYTADRLRALVYVECLCPIRCGNGGVLLLTRGRDGWSIEKWLIRWIS